jgi:hypothetical protein
MLDVMSELAAAARPAGIIAKTSRRVAVALTARRVAVEVDIPAQT